MFEKASDVLVAENRFITDVQLAIEKAMDEARISQAELARMLDVSEARISQLLSDTGQNLQARTIARIAHALSLRPVVELVDAKTQVSRRTEAKKLEPNGGPFKEWLRSLEGAPASGWMLACNDDDEQMGLEAA